MAGADNDQSSDDNRWAKVIKRFEYVIVIALMILLMFIVVITTLEFGWMLWKDVTSPGAMLLDTEETFELFGFFLIILIGVELLTTLKGYVRHGAVHVEVVLEVALIAMAQKLIVLDTKRATGLTLLGLAALVIALAAAFRWVGAWRQRTGGSSG